MYRKCRKCGIPLTSENTYPPLKKRCLCKECYQEREGQRRREKWKNDPLYRERKLKYDKKWRDGNREHFNALVRAAQQRWSAAHPGCYKLKLRNGKTVLVNRRPKPDHCEVCGSPTNKLSWHHWIDDEPEKGVYVCLFCHIIAETIDHMEKSNGSPYNERIRKYLELKESPIAQET